MLAEPPNRINHIVIIADESYSMTPHRRALVTVVDGQIAHLASRSQEMGQETRVTVYTFSARGQAHCLIYDMDVLRVPSIDSRYRPRTQTALIETTLLALDDLAMTPEKYGEHAFLIYVLTDGQENQGGRPHELAARIAGLPDHWTLGAFVPDQSGVHEAKRCGFPAANIAVWDTTSPQGIVEVGEKIRATTENFMEARARGVRVHKGPGGLFQMKTVSAQQVQTQLPALTRGSYELFTCGYDQRIDQFVQAYAHHPYQVGRAYYEFASRTETIQPQKEIAVMVGDDIYTGPAARQMLGLPDHHVRVKPGDHPGYTIFVQSTSYNRKVRTGHRVLVLR